MNKIDKKVDSLDPTYLWLGQFIKQGIKRPLENSRIARSLCCLLISGVSPQSPQIIGAIEHILKLQHEDGGWSNSEDSAWSLYTLARVMLATNALESGCEWLRTVRHEDGGWGYHARDICRIPTTALVCELVPELADERAIDWISQEWEKNLKGPVQLSYKAGFFLLAAGNKKEWIDSDLVEKTIEYLSQDQNDDGGFAPWKNHPIGSDPWSTGVVLWGLSKWGDRVDKQIFKKALMWLRKSQLPCGIWPYHYLDDGASMAVLGIIGAQKAFRGTI